MTLLTLADYFLQSHYSELASLIRPPTSEFLLKCVALYVYRVWHFKE